MKKNRKSIQNQLLLSFITFSVSLSILLVACSYAISVRFVKKRMIEAVSLTIDFVTANIQAEFKGLNQLCDYLYVNKDIKEALENGTTISGDYFLLRSDAYQAIETYVFSHTGDNINYIAILGENGYSLIYTINKADIYTDTNMPISYASILEEADFQTSQTIWGRIKTDKLYPQNENSVEITYIPLYRVLKNKNYSQDIGAICLSVNPRLFYKCLEQYQESTYGQQCSVFITDPHGQLLNSDNSVLTQADAQKILSSADASTGLLEPSSSNYTYYVKSIADGWNIICAMPESTLLQENQYLSTLALICLPLCVLICSLIHYYIFRRIFRPIQAYGSTLKDIASGNSSLRIQVSSNDEIGMLGSNINHMLNEIEHLNEENLSNQLKMRDAFYQEKLAQINPHFLYNTLNSIRWMAMMSENMSIKRAVDSLWHISKYNMDSGNTYFVKLKEEIEIVKEYVYLQKLRYANKFTVDWNYSDSILNYHCPKLLLQPIVENAIIHGAYPKAEETSIIISCYLEDSYLAFNIYDDGCGMSETTRLQLLQFQKGVFSPGSGFKNVLERLYYLYQDRYILDIQSIPEQYTNILIKIPVDFSGTTGRILPKEETT